MNKANNGSPTPDQIAALRQWAEQHGRFWKPALRKHGLPETAVASTANQHTFSK
jgi:hypothetical protein